MKRRSFRVGPVALTSLLLLGLLAAGPVEAGARAATTGTQAAARYIVTLRGLAPVAVSSGRRPAAMSAVAGAAARTAEAARVTRVDRAVADVAQRHGINVGTRYHFALQGFAATLSLRQVTALRADPQVLSLTAVRPVFPADESIPFGVQRVGADPVTNPPPDLSSVNVAVLDTGIRYIPGGDPELNVAPHGIDCAIDGHSGKSGHNAWADVDVANGHGTHVSGTIGAKDTGAGIVGVAPGVRLFAVRIFASQGSSVVGDTETVACGVDWVASTHMASPPAGSQPIDVANMSIQGPIENGDGSTCETATASGDAEHMAICAASILGTTFVVAAGNSSRNAASTVPAAYDSVITVSAMSDYDGLPGALGNGDSCGADPDDSFADYSNFGPAVDLVAPGTCVESLGKTAGSLHQLSGTSMAAPHVTGAAARYVGLLLHALVPHNAANINVDVIRQGLRAAGSFDWTTASDPDGVPDRLLDVAALQAATGRVNLWAFPALLKSGAPPGDAADLVNATISVELQRVGLFAGNVTITATAEPAAGITLTPPAGPLNGLGAAGISATIGVSVGPAAADGDVLLTIRATPGAGGGSFSEKTVTLRVDRHKPTIQTFTAALLDNVQLGDAQPVRLMWSGADPGGTIARYEIQRRVSPSSAWTGFSVSPQTATSSVRLIPLRTDYSFRVRAIDAAGNASEWSVLDLRVGVRDSKKPTISYTGNNSWSTRIKANAYGGSFKRSTSPGAFAAVSFNGRGIAWVAPVSPGTRMAKVSIDGAPFVNVNLSATQQEPRQVVWVSGTLTPGPHTLLIKVVNGIVAVDAILLLR